MSSLRPSVCIDAVLENQSLELALQTVKDAGIPAFEFWAWWEKDLNQIADLRDKYELRISACCTRFISLVDPSRRSEYLQGLGESIDAAKRLGVKTLISQVGDEISGVPRVQQHQALVDGLKAAAPMMEAAGVALVIEPLNVLVDHPNYYLTRSDEAFEIVAEVDSPYVKVIFDIYHQQVSEGHLIQNIQSGIEKIGHFHAAGNPGRHELSRGELSYPSIFEAIRKTAFDGYVALEYWPVDDPATGLREVGDWFKR